MKFVAPARHVAFDVMGLRLEVVLCLALAAVASGDRSSRYQKLSHSHPAFLQASEKDVPAAATSNNTVATAAPTNNTVALPTDPDMEVGKVWVPHEVVVGTTPAPPATTAAPATTATPLPPVITDKELIKERKTINYPELVGTWIVLGLLTFGGLKVMKGPAWNPNRRAPFIAALIILWTINVFATAFYLLSAHNWSWVECVYFCVVTVTTVGYGDFVPIDSVLDNVMLLIFLWFNMFVLSIVLSIVVNSADSGIEGNKGKGPLFHAAFLGGLVLGGASLFSWLEGWTFLEGIFFTTVTLTTVGYGHLLPNSGDASMICACCFILVGVPITGAFVGSLGSTLDGHFKAFKDKKSQTFLFCGYVSIIIGWLLLGATVFHQMNSHGWGWSECLYFAAVTMTTVGYGDYVPTKTATDHVLCIAYIWCSVVVIATVFGDFTGMVIDMFTKGMHRHKAVLTQGCILGTIICSGIGLFAYLEGWGVLKGLTFTSVTCTTVGYGHYLPSTHEAKLGCVPFLLLAVPMTGALVSNISGLYSDEIGTLIADIDADEK